MPSNSCCLQKPAHKKKNNLLRRFTSIFATHALCFSDLQAYTSQFVALIMFALLMCDDKISMQPRRREIIQGLKVLPGKSSHQHFWLNWNAGGRMSGWLYTLACLSGSKAYDGMRNVWPLCSSLPYSQSPCDGSSMLTQHFITFYISHFSNKILSHICISVLHDRSD